MQTAPAGEAAAGAAAIELAQVSSSAAHPAAGNATAEEATASAKVLHAAGGSALSMPPLPPEAAAAHGSDADARVASSPSSKPHAGLTGKAGAGPNRQQQISLGQGLSPWRRSVSASCDVGRRLSDPEGEAVPLTHGMANSGPGRSSADGSFVRMHAAHGLRWEARGAAAGHAKDGSKVRRGRVVVDIVADSSLHAAHQGLVYGRRGAQSSPSTPYGRASWGPAMSGVDIKVQGFTRVQRLSRGLRL